MNNSVDVEFSRGDLVRLNLELAPRYRSNWVLFVLVALAPVLYSIVHYPHELSARNIAIAAASGLVGAMAAALVWFLLTSAISLLSNGPGGGVLGLHHYAIEDKGLRETTAANETLIKWGGARRIFRTERAIYIQIASAQFHVIPRRCFRSGQHFNEFWNAIQRLWSNDAL